MVLNAIYEEDFLGFSYGFRPGRGPHDALDALVVGIANRKVNHILDADIRSFFDTVGQQWLIRFVEHRIGDKRIIRFTWKRIEKLADDFLPTPRILHPWPSDRFAVKHPRWEYAGNPHVRICAGGVQ